MAAPELGIAANPNRSIGFGLVVVMASLYGFWGLWQQYQRANVSASWPSVAGFIEKAELKPSDRWKSKAVVKLRYLYSIEGRQFAGTAIHQGEYSGDGTEVEATEAEEKYRVGRRLQVYYNPKDPSEAVLEPGVAAAGEPLGKTAFLLGLVLFSGGAAMFHGLQRLRPRPAA